jgi:hypothetical protein
LLLEHLLMLLFLLLILLTLSLLLRMLLLLFISLSLVLLLLGLASCCCFCGLSWGGWFFLLFGVRGSKIWRADLCRSLPSVCDSQPSTSCSSHNS